MTLVLDALVAQIQTAGFEDGKTEAEPKTYFVDDKPVKVIDYQTLFTSMEKNRSENAKASHEAHTIDIMPVNYEPEPPIPVIVGPVGRNEVFQLSRELIQQSAPSILSEYERNEQRQLCFVMFEDEDLDLFKSWLRHVTIPLPRAALLSGSIQEMFRLYVLAEKLGDVATKNVIAFSLSVYYQRKREAPTPEDVKIVWEGTPEWSPMRHMCVTAWTIFGHNGKWSVEEQKRFPDGFFAALAGSLLTLKDLQYFGKEMDMRLVPNDFLEIEN